MIARAKILGALALMAGLVLPLAGETDRSPQWPAVQRAHLKIEPACVACGKKVGREVHHIVPFHVAPERELDRANLITLCRLHHFVFGHLGNWQSWNVDVRADAAAYRAKVRGRPKAVVGAMGREISSYGACEV